MSPHIGVSHPEDDGKPGGLTGPAGGGELEQPCPVPSSRHRCLSFPSRGWVPSPCCRRIRPRSGPALPLARPAEEPMEAEPVL